MLTNQSDHVSDMCRAATIENYQTKIETCGSHQKKLYQVMNELFHRKGPSLLPAHDSGKDLADWLCTFLTEKIPIIRSQLDSISLTDRHTVLSPITSSLGEGLSTFTVMTNQEILKIIKNLPTKSCSLDPLPTCFLKKTDTLPPTITQIINKSSINHWNVSNQFHVSLSASPAEKGDSCHRSITQLQTSVQPAIYI